MNPGRIGTALAVALAASGAGCGGGDGGGGGLTAAEYREQGNALCREGVASAQRVKPPSGPEEFADYLERLFASSDRLAERFEALDPPASLQADHDRSIALSRETRKKTDALVERVRRSDDPPGTAVRGFRELRPQTARSIEISKRLGLSDCTDLNPGAAPPESS